MISVDTLLALIVMLVIVILQLLVELPSMPRYAEACVNKIVDCFQRPVCWSRAKSRRAPASPLDNRVAQRLTDIRVEYLLGMLHLWTYFCGAYAASFCIRVFLGLPLITDPFLFAMFAISHVTALVVRRWPQLLNQNTLWIIHSWYMGMILYFGVDVAIDDVNRFAHYSPQMLLVRVTFSLAYPAVWPNLVWNLAWTVLSTTVLLQADVARAGIPTSNIIWAEMAVAGFVSFVLWRIELHQTSQVRSELEATGYLRAKGTMERLLSLMCDAVAELDPALCVKEPCPKMASLLFRHTSTTALKGESFPNMVLSEADRERFREFVKPRTVPLDGVPASSPDDDASSMYLNLRDADGTAVSVQLFHSCHHDPPNEICHIVGVREVERESTARDAVRDELPALNNTRDRVCDDTESVVSVASSVTSADTAPGLALLIPEDAMAAPVSALIDPVAMKVLGCTNGFKSLTGPLFYKAQVKDFVVNYEEFEVWLQSQVRRHVAGEELAKFPIKVTPPLAKKRARFEFQADAYVLSVEPAARISEMGIDNVDDELDEEHEFLCILALSDAEPHWLQSRRERRERVAAPARSPRSFEEIHL